MPSASGYISEPMMPPTSSPYFAMLFMSRHIRCLVVLLSVVCALAVSAQRRVTPVSTPPPVSATTQERTPKAADRTNVVSRTDSHGNIILVDTISGSEFNDTIVIERPPQHIYPKLNGTTVGLNILDPVMRLLGQDYGGVDVWGQLSIYNRYFPTLTIGAGTSDFTPDGNNFTFKSPIAPYFKLGCAYNMFYNSNPDYQFQVGLMYGFSAFSYKVTDVTVTDSYWQETSHFTIPSTSTSAGWLEITFGVKVKIAGPWSLGWNVKYHKILHEGAARSGKPVYIPGYGKRGNALALGFSLMYTLPWPVKSAKTADTADEVEHM